MWWVALVCVLGGLTILASVAWVLMTDDDIESVEQFNDFRAALGGKQ